MLQKSITYYLFILLIAGSLVSCGGKNSIPSLRESFSRKDKNPFGTYVAYEEVRQLFSKDSIQVKKDNFDKTWKDIADTGSLYIIISRNLYLTDEDRSSMLSYAASGNSLFISSENIDKGLLDSLHCYSEDREYFDQDDVSSMKYTNVTLSQIAYSDTTTYSYFYYPTSNSLPKFDSTVDKSTANFDSSNATVMGLNEYGEPNCVVVNYGRGRVYLHCEPRVLGNYFLLQKNNYIYLQQLLSFMPPTPQYVYWDDCYNKINYIDKNGRSSLGYILQFPAMRWAFFLLLALLIIYILFGGKRRQRVVRVIEPNKNTTVAFAETIGRLYLQKKDNRNIADKIINYFYEQIRNQYFLNTNHINDEFITALSRKSNVSKESTEKLFDTINNIQQADKVSDQQLLSLNQQIEIFNKK
ncbi:MAG TPA: DUF4350 domain-containing protein [Ferruginibacter sp.]|nr:DUF4350 domain-containing protein [Ferruginibacter sp.]